MKFNKFLAFSFCALALYTAQGSDTLLRPNGLRRASATQKNVNPNSKTPISQLSDQELIGRFVGAGKCFPGLKCKGALCSPKVVSEMISELTKRQIPLTTQALSNINAFENAKNNTAFVEYVAEQMQKMIPISASATPATQEQISLWIAKEFTGKSTEVDYKSDSDDE